jgi:hypothetical protein
MKTLIALITFLVLSLSFPALAERGSGRDPERGDKTTQVQ